MKKSRRTYNGVHLNKKSNTQDVVEQSLTEKKRRIQVIVYTMKKNRTAVNYEKFTAVLL